MYEEEPNIGVDEIADNSAMQLYPNPAKSFTKIKVNAFIPDATIEIINLNGAVVAVKHAAINKNIPINLNVSQLAAGNYFVRIKGGDEDYVEKLIITK